MSDNNNIRRANGYARDKVVKRVRREETHCWLCKEPVDKTLTYLWGSHGPKCSNPDCPGCTPHPQRGEVDEVIPVSLGGSPIDRSNCRLSHRACNNRRGNKLPGTPPPKTTLITSGEW